VIYDSASIDLDTLSPMVRRRLLELEREAQDRRLDLETIARHEAFMLQQGKERDEALAKLRVAEDKITELRKDLAEALDSLEAEVFGDCYDAWHRVREKWAL